MTFKFVNRAVAIGLILVSAGAGAARAAVSGNKITASAATCVLTSSSGSATFDISNPGTNNGFGQWQSGSGNATLVCPVDGYSTIDVGSVAVDVWKNNSTSVLSKACVTFAGGWGGNCGAGDSNSSSGVQALAPSTSMWTSNPNDYRFVLVTMSGSGNSMFGYRQN
jgi:hypothetical protein